MTREALQIRQVWRLSIIYDPLGISGVFSSAPGLPQIYRSDEDSDTLTLSRRLAKVSNLRLLVSFPVFRSQVVRLTIRGHYTFDLDHDLRRVLWDRSMRLNRQGDFSPSHIIDLLLDGYGNGMEFIA